MGHPLMSTVATPLLTKADLLRVAEGWYDPNRVSIDPTAARHFRPTPSTQERAGHPDPLDRLHWRAVAAKSLVFNSLNYQFWDLQGDRFIRYAHEGTVGAMGLRRAFERAWGTPDGLLAQAVQGRPLTTPDIASLFGPLPNPESRAAILNEVLTRGDLGTAVDWVVPAVLEGDGFDVSLAHRVAQLFPLAYGDPVLKKAQLALSEVWVATQEAGLAVRCDLTAFADYQIPNVLRAMGVLRYHPGLVQQIDAFTPLAPGSHDECAIRGASLLAVEHMAHHLEQPVATVDHLIWSLRKEATTPFHLTFTTMY